VTCADRLGPTAGERRWTGVNETRTETRHRAAGLRSDGVVRGPVEAIAWALHLAPIPCDRNGQTSSACKFVPVALANQVGRDRAFPVGGHLVRYTSVSERTVRTCPSRLEAAASCVRAIWALSRPG